MTVWRRLVIGFVGMLAFWFAFWLLGAWLYYGQQLEKHRLELLLKGSR